MQRRRDKQKLERPPRVEPGLNLSPTEAAYLAGFFDGEGMVTIHRDLNQGARGRRVNPNYTMSVRISQSSKPVLDWIKARVGGSVTEKRVSSDRRHWLFAEKSNNAKRLLEAMLPYLIVKRDQAVQAIAFQQRQQAHKNRYEAGRIGPVPRTAAEIAYKEHYLRLLQQLKRPQET
jgi:hypothetical protein